MKLYATEHSTFCRRVRIALLEKGVDAERIDTPAEVRSRPEYLAINPYGRVPALVDEDVTLFESTAILEYLEERWPKPPLYPDTAADRARARMLCKLCDLEFSSRAVVIQWPQRNKQPESSWDHERFARLRPEIERHYAYLEGVLGPRDYLVADRFTVADLCYLPFLHFRHLLDVPVPATVEAWAARLLERPSARQTVPSK